MSRKNLAEDGTLGKVTEAKSDGSYKIQVISPGLGSSGWYSAEVLEAAAKAKVWPKGTKVFFDHPTATEDEERPARSVKDLAAVLTEDATWNGSALVARIKPTGGLGQTVLENETFRQSVGISVRASAEGDVGEVGGKPTWIVKEIFPDTFNSVDLVTYAGRGGAILESARQTQVAESVSDKPWSDFSQSDYDDAQWKRACLIDTGDGEGKARYKLPVKEPSGALNRNAVHAAAGRIGQADVSADLKKAAAKKLVSLYRNQLDEDPPKALLTAAGMSEAASESATPNVPVHPAGQSTTTKEHTMPEIEEGATVTVKETRMRQLEADAGRVPMLESELATEKARADKAENDLKIAEARDYAREFGSTRVKDANSELASPIVDKIVNEAMRDITLGEDGRLDTDAFGAKVDAARKAEETYLASIAENVGSVRGLGEAKDKKVVEAAVVTDTVSNVFSIARKGA